MQAPRLRGSAVACIVVVMAGNPKTSKWRNTPDHARHRKPLRITLSDEERAALTTLAEKHGCNLSQMVAALVKSANVS